MLERRRESLEACEIEANQRQYIVHRMLITGLLPEYRPADIDNIPNVIPCLLPIELISGARVVPAGDLPPSTATSVTTPTTTTPVPERPVPVSRPLSAQSDTQEVGVSTEDFRPEPKSKSIGIQSESFLAITTTIPTTTNAATPYTAIVTPSSMYHSATAATSTSLRRQIERDRFMSSYSISQPRVRTAETQTNGVTSYDSHYNGKTSNGRRHKSSTTATTTTNHFSASEPNLLESTAKYFAEYDRQLREHGRRLKNRFSFTDDDPVMRESRKQRVMDELAQRKEKISSMVDLRSPPSFPTIHPTSDYSSTVPHYGSLPRIDFPTTRSPRMRLRDYTSRGRSHRNSSGYGYGSLPRNYERYMDRDFDGAQGDFMQPLSTSARRYDALSRSWQDLNLPTEDTVLDPRMRLYATRSMKYLDPRSSYQRYPESGASFGRPMTKAAYDDLYTPPPPPPPPEYLIAAGPRGQQHFDGPQSLPNADIISQYANYLSNQFISDQQKLMSSYPSEETMYQAQAKQRPYTTSRFGASASDIQTTIQPPVMMDYDNTMPPTMDVVDSAYVQPSEQQIQDPTTLDSYANLPPAPPPPSVQYAQTDQYDNWPWYQQQQQLQQQPFYYTRATSATAGTVPAYSSFSGHYPRFTNTLAGDAAPLLGQVYSRNDTNYGSRPTHYATEYGNFYRNRTARQLENLSNRNYIPWSQHPFNPYHPSNRFVGAAGEPLSLSQPSVFADTSGYRINQPYASRAWSNGNLPANTYDTVYPREDALSRMYATLGNQRNVMRMQPHYGNIVTSLQY